ncbi:MAG TPA: hypothetical protein V6D11_27465 [Waterburya sp.]
MLGCWPNDLDILLAHWPNAANTSDAGNAMMESVSRKTTGNEAADYRNPRRSKLQL